jgi:SAM-dependent methyltransferase
MDDNPVELNSYRNKTYSVCNQNILAWVPLTARVLLDVGCGTGQNSAALRQRIPEIHTYGLTVSPLERDAASEVMDGCWACDIEEALPPEIQKLRFDVILCSHVLEHLHHPESVLRRLLALLHPSGRVLIALPNIAFYKHRLQLALGRFKYQTYGVFDETHLRFFTWDTARAMVSSARDTLNLSRSAVHGNVPLGPARHLLGKRMSQKLDALGRRLYPNLFGSEILLDAVLNPEIVP